MKKLVGFFILIVLMMFALVPSLVVVAQECDDWGHVETLGRDMWVSPIEEDEFLILVNADNYLGIDHHPADLVPIGSGHRLRAGAALAFFRMQDSMNAEGLYLTIRSGYRPYVDQRVIFNRAVTNWGYETAIRWWARPGHSEHQTGLAVDILQRGYTGTILNNANFEDTPQYTWLIENAHNYGFILSYPADYESITGIAYEPWHWRYIGVNSAMYMKENDFPVFELYIEHRQSRTESSH